MVLNFFVLGVCVGLFLTSSFVHDLWWKRTLLMTVMVVSLVMTLKNVVSMF